MEFMKKYGRYVGLSLMFISLYLIGVSLSNLALIAVIVFILSNFRRSITTHIDKRLAKFELYSNAHPTVKKVILILAVILIYITLKEFVYFISNAVFGFDLYAYYAALFKPLVVN